MKITEVFRKTLSSTSEHKGELSLFQQVVEFVDKYGYKKEITQSLEEEQSGQVMWAVKTSRLFTPPVEQVVGKQKVSYRIVEEFEANPDITYGIGQDGFSLRATVIDKEGRTGEEETRFRIRETALENEREILEILQYMENELNIQEESGQNSI